MTVVLAIRCADGLVMGADTQITDSDRGMSYPARKLHLLGDHAAWGGSGARAVLGDLVGDFDDAAGTIIEAPDISRALQDRVLPVLRRHYENYIEHVPGEPDSKGTPSTYVLAAGYSGDDPWIVEIDPHGMVGRYEDIGFHAVGSGAPMAQQAGALLAHFRMVERSIDYGVVVAQRVLDALSYTSPSVGGPFDMVRITSEGVRRLDDDEIEEAREHVRRWTDLEQKMLDGLFD